MRTRSLATSMLAVTVGLALAACAHYAPPAKANLTGQWRGNWTYEPPPVAGGTALEATLNQSGENVTGTMTVPGSARRVPVKGVVYGDEVRLDGENVTGWLALSGDTLTGRVYGVFPESGRLYGVYTESETLTRVK